MTMNPLWSPYFFGEYWPFCVAFLQIFVLLALDPGVFHRKADAQAACASS